MTETKKDSIPLPHLCCERPPLAMKSGKESRVLSETHGVVSTMAFSIWMLIPKLHEGSSRATPTRDSDVLELDAGQPGKRFRLKPSKILSEFRG